MRSVVLLFLFVSPSACGAGAATEPRVVAGGGAGAGGGSGGGAGAGTAAPAATGPICTALGTGGVRLEEDFVVVDPPIRFGRGDALHASASAALDGISEVMGRCTGAKIEVRVSAAARGDADAALRSATARAEAIRSGLTTRGVDAGRVAAVGVARSGFLEGLAVDDAAAVETEIVRVDPVGCE